LGQNFAEAFDVKFTNKEGKQEHVWATSWGVSTRLIGGLIMTHSDDLGLVLPPKLAPIQVVIVPIYKSQEQLDALSEKAVQLVKALKNKGVSVKFDNRTTHKPGWKFAEYEMKGVPLRIALGPRDLENGTLELARRDTLEKEVVAQEAIEARVLELLEEIQEQLFQKAKTYRDDHITKVDDFKTFQEVLDSKGGFVLAHWDGTEETEDKIKEKTKATIRCIAIDAPEEEGKCVFSGKPSQKRVLFAKAY
jgi:prolyl-tRNA synthetase